MSLSMTASALCTSFSMHVKRLWIAFTVPMIFDLDLDARGAFSAVSFAIAALVFGVGWLADQVVLCTLKTVASLFCKDSPWGLSLCNDSLSVVTSCKDSPLKVTPHEETPRKDSRGDFL